MSGRRSSSHCLCRHKPARHRSEHGAIFLILELDEPFGGLIEISGEPMANALHQLGK